MPDLFDAPRRESHLSPPTAYLCFLLSAPRTRDEAGREARRLGVDLGAARFWFENCGRR